MTFSDMEESSDKMGYFVDFYLRKRRKLISKKSKRLKRTNTRRKTASKKARKVLRKIKKKKGYITSSQTLIFSSIGNHGL
jgi:hypothetical protein